MLARLAVTSSVGSPRIAGGESSRIRKKRASLVIASDHPRRSMFMEHRKFTSTARVTAYMRYLDSGWLASWENAPPPPCPVRRVFIKAQIRKPRTNQLLFEDPESAASSSRERQNAGEYYLSSKMMDAVPCTPWITTTDHVVKSVLRTLSTFASIARTKFYIVHNMLDCHFLPRV